MMEQAVILAGGRGTRLGELTCRVPKPLLPVAGVPFVEHLLWNLKRHGIRRIVLLVGYLAEQFTRYFDGRRADAVEIRCVVESDPAGTAGALRAARGQLDEAFWVLNGDTLFDLNYLDLAVLLEESGAAAAVALRRVDDAGRYGAIELGDGRIRAFREKSAAGPGLVNGGVYAMRNDALDGVSRLPCSAEAELFPPLAAVGALAGKAYDGFFLDMGTPESLRAAQQQVAAWRRKPAVFFDRDGVLNQDCGYVHSPEQFAWTAGAPQAVKWLNDHGWLAIVVTNQSGIARGLYGEDQFRQFTAWVDEQLRAHGAHLDATYYCPHHAEAGLGPYRVACQCRKPAPGMILRALAEWDIDPAASVLIGDQPSDFAAAEAAGVRPLRFAGGNLLEFVRSALPARSIEVHSDNTPRR